MQEVEVNNRDSRKLYEMIKHRNSTSKKTQRIGNKRWETYYTELFREEKEITGRKKEKVEMEDSNNEDDAPSYDEYMEIIAQLKTKKAAGPDQISNELIKQGGHELLSRVYRILVAVWQSETMPEEWRTGLLIPLLKKGDPTQCNNYRGIMLLNTTYKILTSIIRKRLAEHTETKLGEYQNGFRKGKSTIDAIHVMSQIIEKSYEYDIELHILFIDFKQAFDNINRRSLVDQMQQMQIPEKLIKLTKITMDNSRARISTTEGVTNEINIERGVRQGDAIYRLQTSLRQHKQAQSSRANATNENTGETNQTNENDDGQLKSKNIYNRGCNKRNKHRKRSQARRRTVHNALQHRTRRCNKGCRTGQSYYGECNSSNSLRR
jgi:hypothetical protein